MQGQRELGRRTLCNLLSINAVQGATKSQYLDCTEGVQQMGIMALRTPKASIGMLA